MELVPVGTYDVAGVENAAQIAREELGPDHPITFPKIKVPGGGSTTWEIDEATPPTKELRGVVVAHHRASRLYLDSFENADPENRRPDAWSNDGKVQVIPKETYEKINERNKRGQNLPYPLADVSQCPYHQWPNSGGVSLGGAGKAASEYVEIYMLVDGADSAMPFQVSIPGTSMKAWSEYAQAIVMRGKRLCDVETVITLRKEKSKGGVEYAKAEFSQGRLVDPEERPAMTSYSFGVKALVTKDPFAHAALEAPAQQPQALPAPDNVEAAIPAPQPVIEAAEAPPSAVTEQAMNNLAAMGATPVAAGGVIVDDDDISF